MNNAWRGFTEETGAESLTVHTAGTGWRGDKQGGDHIPERASTWAQSAALSMSAVSPHDVRPHLLALMRWERGDAIEPCLAYGRNYLRAWCHRKRQRPRPAVIAAATMDALALVFWGRCRRGMPTIEDRRTELRVDKGRFAEYRALMAEVFERRLSEAVTRYKAISYSQPRRNTDYLANGFAGSSLWITAHEHPGLVLTLIPAIQHPQSGIMGIRQDLTAMIAPSRARAA